jgi:hypothetical protein
MKFWWQDLEDRQDELGKGMRAYLEEKDAQEEVREIDKELPDEEEKQWKKAAKENIIKHLNKELDF